ncbi:MAG: NUDIX hydrolase [Chloroflexi bacterium]|nr:NUDIX hydrolase [Chloroflexota bacterium]
MIPEEGRSRLRCESCGRIHYLNPRVVAAVIVEHEGRIVLQKRAMEPRSGFWTFPGGFLEVGEDAAEGARREAREEVGLEVTITGLQGVYVRPHAAIVLIVYTGTSASGAAIVADHESTAVGWYAPEEIPWAALAFETTEAALRDWTLARHETAPPDGSGGQA